MTRYKSRRTSRSRGNPTSRTAASRARSRVPSDQSDPVFQDTLEALKELSTFFTENTLNSRRNLRSKIERRSLAINEEFLATFREVKASLDDVYQNVLAMNTAVQSMTDRLQATKAQTSQLIEQTSKLQSER